MQDEGRVQLYVDDLLVWGILGDTVPAVNGKLAECVYTQINLEIHYNQSQIIQVCTNQAPLSSLLVLMRRKNSRLTFSTPLSGCLQPAPSKLAFICMKTWALCTG